MTTRAQLEEQFDQLSAAVLKVKRERDNAVCVLVAVVKGFDYDHGHSDLDDAQPINVRMTLGDYRKAYVLLHT